MEFSINYDLKYLSDYSKIFATNQNSGGEMNPGSRITSLRMSRKLQSFLC